MPDEPGKESDAMNSRNGPITAAHTGAASATKGPDPAARAENPAAHSGVDALAGLDLNLLTALRALLKEKSVTRAAARLGLGQPGTSAALRRLRAHFGDPLLARAGPAYVLTPLAAALLTPVESAVAAVESVLLGREEFRPETSTRRFAVMAADAGIALLGERLLPQLSGAPHAVLDFLALSDEAMEDAAQVLEAVDAVVLPRGVLAGYPSLDLWTDEWAVVVGDRTTEVDLAAMTWVSSFHGSPSPVTAALESWGLRPRVRAIVPSYLALPLLLAHSRDHVAILQRRLAERLSALGGVRVLPGPPDAPQIRMALWWHPSRTADPGHAWLRDRVLDATAPMRVAAGPSR